MRYLIWLILGGGLILTACTQKTASLEAGAWRFGLMLQEGVELPFMSTLDQIGDAYILTIHNDTEDIRVQEITRWGDSIFIRMPVFDSEFQGKITSSSSIEGVWRNYSRGADYQIPFSATKGETLTRFVDSQSGASEIASIWQATFSKGTPDSVRAIGEFDQNASHLRGTFLTETGDYRFLEGIVDGDQVKLSCFDGAHAFLFTAQLNAQGELNGTFLSGNHWEEPWTAYVDPNASLRPPESLTFLKEGYDKLQFSFPDLEGKMVSLEDPRFRNKVVLVQILGSWCPNCMDETKLYAKWYDTYQDRGLEIVGLAYERASSMEQARHNVARMKSQLKARYPILIASIDNDKVKAAETLPMLNHILSYPTSIYIDREGNIQKIHTGFYGPGTGNHYVRFLEEYTPFLENLLGQKENSDFALLTP
ncbi:MAG: TlpA disulfide reductase family protein [Bacteroidota bacterium]